MDLRCQKKLTKGQRKGMLTNTAPERVHSYVCALCLLAAAKCDQSFGTVVMCVLFVELYQ
jgi:hypothetical protein